MAYGDAITSPLPTPSVTADATAVSQLRTWADEVEARLEAKVTEAGILVGGDLEMNDNALTEVDGVKFDDNAATKTGAGEENQAYVKDGELYFTNSSGTTVRLTDAGTIDVGSLKGITGDYSSDGDADVDYTTSTVRYRFLSTDSTKVHAEIEARLLRLTGSTANPTNIVNLEIPAGLAASYTMSLPTNDPASGTELLQWDSTGDMSSTKVPSVTSITASTDVSTANLKLDQDTMPTWGDDATLTEYQKLTFTPTCKVNSVSQTVLNSIGRATMVGNMVFFFIAFDWVQGLSVTGKSIEVGGLPTTFDDPLAGGVGIGQLFPVATDDYATNDNNTAMARWRQGTGDFIIQESTTSSTTAFWNLTATNQYQFCLSGVLYDNA